MADTAEKPGGMLDARKAKAIFVLGVSLYLLMTFWTSAKRYSIEQMKSKLAQLQAEKDHELEPPVEPIKPEKPGDDKTVADSGKLGAKFDELNKKYEEEKKKYDEKLKEYRRDEWLYMAEDHPDTREDMKELGRDIAWAEASANSWAYWAFVGRFIGVILMLVGLAFTALNGSEWERAAAIVVLGLCLVGIGGALGR